MENFQVCSDSNTICCVENICCTENGDKAFVTSGSHCLDFFSRIVRNAPMMIILMLFVKHGMITKRLPLKS